MSGAAALALLVAPGLLEAQEDCVGTKPGGGRAVSSAELYLTRAQRAGKPEDKRNLYQQGLTELERDMERRADNPNPRVYLLAGRFYVETDRYATADSAWKRAEELWSCYHATIDTFRYNAWVNAYNRGVRYAGAEDDEQALESYEKAWTIYDRLPQPQIQSGSVYANQALNPEISAEEQGVLRDKAIAAYEAALTAFPRMEPGRLSEDRVLEFGRAASFNLAQLLAMDERFEEAAQAYTQFLEQEPGNVDAITNAAVVLTRASRAYNRESLEMEDGPEKEALQAKSDSLRRVATDYYEQLVNREDLEAEDYHNIGNGLAQIGLNAEAATAFEKALDLAPYRANSLEQLALALFREGQYDRLLASANLLVQRYPLSMNNLAMLANAYRELGQTDSALAILQRRELVDLELMQLDLTNAEGTYTISGQLYNIKHDAASPVQMVFDFYDDAGTVVATETVTFEAPPAGAASVLNVSIESPALISGFTYRRPDTSGT
jgi:tetratricopeptide (TPR) repeat protein